MFAWWVVKLQADAASRFSGKVLELGAGAGVPGLAAQLYSDAAAVTLTVLPQCCPSTALVLLQYYSSTTLVLLQYCSSTTLVLP